MPGPAPPTAEDAESESGHSSEDKKYTTKIFLSYRRKDGAKCADWLFEQLKDRIHIEKNAKHHLDIYYDQMTPGVPNWKEHLQPNLEAAKALIVICTPGLARNVSEPGRPDNVYLELEWWLKHRDTAPIVIDTTGEGDRWLPKIVSRKWPYLNRIELDEQSILESESQNNKVYVSRFLDRLFATIWESKRGTGFEELVREKSLTQKLYAALALAIVAMIFAVGSASIAKKQKDLAELRTIEAQQQRQVADQTTKFLTDLFRKADPDKNYRDALTARRLLSAGAATVDGQVSDPEVKSRLLLSIGSAHTGLGLAEEAIAILRKAENAIAGQAVSVNLQATLRLAIGEAKLYVEDYESAFSDLNSAYELVNRSSTDPSELHSAVLIALGDFHSWSPDGSEVTAREKYIEALEVDRQIDRKLLVARDENRIGYLDFSQGNMEQARERFSAAKEIADESQATLMRARYENDLGGALYESDDLAAAETAFANARAAMAEVFGRDDGAVGGIENNLARLLLERSATDEAKELLHHAKLVQTEAFGGQFYGLGFTLNNLGYIQLLENDASARSTLKRSEEISAQKGLPIRPQTLVHIAETYLSEDKLLEAEKWLFKARDDFDNRKISSGWRYAILQSAMGELRTRQCFFSEAEILLDASRDAFNKRWEAQNSFKDKLAEREANLRKRRNQDMKC